MLDDELVALRAVAASLARQSGRGVARRVLLELGGSTVTVLRPDIPGDPVLAVVRSGGGRDNRFAALTPREREVAMRLAAGHPNKRIAADLGISLATVKDHVHRILVKTGLRSRVAVAAAWHRR